MVPDGGAGGVFVVIFDGFQDGLVFFLDGTVMIGVGEGDKPEAQRPFVEIAQQIALHHIFRRFR